MIQTTNTPGQKLRLAVAENYPLQVVGAVTAYCAILAQKSGHKALYLSGGGVAASSLGIPDLGITTLHDVCEDARRITAVSNLPLLVDIDTGWGGAFNIASGSIGSNDVGSGAIQSGQRSSPSAWPDR